MPLRHCKRPLYAYINWCGSVLNILFYQQPISICTIKTACIHFNCMYCKFPRINDSGFLIPWENIYTLSYHHQIGSMNYYPLFRVRSWNSGVSCMSFYILMVIFHSIRHQPIGRSPTASFLLWPMNSYGNFKNTFLVNFSVGIFVYLLSIYSFEYVTCLSSPNFLIWNKNVPVEGKYSNDRCMHIHSIAGNFYIVCTGLILIIL